METPTEPAAAYAANSVPTQFIEAAGVRYAYRLFGRGEAPPLLFSQRFGGTMDDWDPALIDAFAAQRRVLLFDSAGIGRSTGQTPSTFVGIAHAIAALVEALGLAKVDVLGWSMGGYVASHFASERPDLVRRLILAASGTGYLDGAPAIPSGPSPAGLSPDELYLRLHFTDSPQSQAAGKAHLARLARRTERLAEPFSVQAAQAMMAARSIVMTPEGSLMHRMPRMAMPVLVTNGLHDTRIPAFYSFTAAQTLPDAKLILYPDAAHGFLFQHMDVFVPDAIGFLDD